MGGMFGGKPDNSAALAQIAAQREETALAREKASAEKRDLEESLSAKKRARRTGGSRMLLSESRLTPETGVDEEDTLGA